MEFIILKHTKIKFMKKTLALIQSKLLLVGKGAKNVVYRIKVKDVFAVAIKELRSNSSNSKNVAFTACYAKYPQAY